MVDAPNREGLERGEAIQPFFDKVLRLSNAGSIPALIATGAHL